MTTIVSPVVSSGKEYCAGREMLVNQAVSDSAPPAFAGSFTFIHIAVCSLS
jgi:hypothetical protein